MIRRLHSVVRRRRPDSGSAALELVLAAPLLVLFIGLVTYAGRIAIAGQSVEAAAAEAARTASISRDGATAAARARAAAADTLNRQGLNCLVTRVDVDTSAFAAPAGTPGTVTATVSCQVRLAGVVFPGWPGTQTMDALASSPLDTYRER